MQPSEQSPPVFPGIHTFGLAAFALSLPLFLTLSDSPEFFFAHGFTPAQLRAFAAIVGWVLPAGLALTVWAANAGEFRGTRNWGWGLGGVLATLAFLPTLNRLSFLPGAVGLVIAFLLGALAVYAYSRFKSVRDFCSLLILGAVVYPMWFAWTLGAIAPVEDGSAEIDVAAGDGERPPIVWLMFDEFSVESLLDETGAIDAERFPHFAALASESTWFRDTSTVAEMTTEAIPALLTGRYPVAGADREPSYVDHPRNAFTLFHAAGYPVHAHETMTRLCPPRINRADAARGGVWRPVARDIGVVFGHVFFGDVLGPWLPSMDRQVANFGQAVPEVPLAGRRALQTADDAAFRTAMVAPLLSGLSAHPDGFHYLHLNLPHQEYQFLGSGRTYLDSEQLMFDPSFLGIDGSAQSTHADGARTTLTYPLALARQRYLLQVQYADFLLGVVIARLRELDTYARSVVVVTADHGVSFLPGESDRFAVARGAETVGDEGHARDILKIPFFIKRPGQRGAGRVDTPAETVDVLPTLLHVAGLSLDTVLDGTALNDETVPGADVHTLYSHLNGSVVEHATAPDAPGYLAERASWTVRTENFRPRSAWDDAVLGREVSALNVAATPLSGVRVEARRADVYSSVDLESRYVPALFSAALVFEEGAEEPEGVAIALNGRVRAIAVPYEDQRGGGRVRAMLPESGFVQGVNLVRLFGIVEREGSIQLAPIEGGSIP